ncbi:MAG: stage III sporulation protein AC [Clostridia bacterium]|nr:stage III sporulation protein AC [Clostridia bacterium]
MDISIIFKIAGIGLLIAVAYQILQRSGREEQALLLSLTGVVFVLLILVGEIGDLFNKIRGIFGI